MKRKFGFLAVVCICVLGLLFNACNDESSSTNIVNGPDDEPNRIPVKFGFNSEDPGERSIIGRSHFSKKNRNVSLDGNEIQEIPLNYFNDVYDLLGTFKGYITPTEFKIIISDNFTLVGNNGSLRADLVSGNGHPEVSPLEQNLLLDLTEPVLIDVGDIESGFYEGIFFMLRNDLDLSEQFEIIKWDGNTEGIPLRHLEIVNYTEQNIGNLKGFLFVPSDNEYKMFQGSVGFNDVIPGYSGDRIGGSDNEFVLIVPFEGINIPENANAVRFEITWDLEDLIAHYYGPNIKKGGIEEDIFVLKNGWWNNLSITAVLE